MLAVNGSLRVRPERSFLGRSLGAAAAAVWKSDGERAAVDAIDAVNRHFTGNQIQWVPLEHSNALAVDRRAPGDTPTGQPLTGIVSEGDTDGRRSCPSMSMGSGAASSSFPSRRPTSGGSR